MDQLYHIFHSLSLHQSMPNGGRSCHFCGGGVAECLPEKRPQHSTSRNVDKDAGRTGGGGSDDPASEAWSFPLPFGPTATQKEGSSGLLFLLLASRHMDNQAPLHQCLFRPEKSAQTGLTWGPESDRVVVSGSLGAWSGRRRFIDIDNQRVACASSNFAYFHLWNGRT